MEAIVLSIVGERRRCICEHCDDARIAGDLHRNVSTDTVLLHTGTGTLWKLLRHPESDDTSILVVPLSERQHQLCNRPSRPSLVLHATGQHRRSIGPVKPSSSDVEIEAPRSNERMPNPSSDKIWKESGEIWKNC